MAGVRRAIPTGPSASFTDRAALLPGAVDSARDAGDWDLRAPPARSSRSERGHWTPSSPSSGSIRRSTRQPAWRPCPPSLPVTRASSPRDATVACWWRRRPASRPGSIPGLGHPHTLTDPSATSVAVAQGFGSSWLVEPDANAVVRVSESGERTTIPVGTEPERHRDRRQCRLGCQPPRRHGRRDRSGHERARAHHACRRRADWRRSLRAHRLGGEQRGGIADAHRCPDRARHRQRARRRQPTLAGRRRRQGLGHGAAPRVAAGRGDGRHADRQPARARGRDQPRPGSHLPARLLPDRVLDLLELVNYPDAQGAAGSRLVPDAATSLPTLSRRPAHADVRDPEAASVLPSVEPGRDGRDLQELDRAQPEPSPGSQRRGANRPGVARGRRRCTGVRGREAPPHLGHLSTRQHADHPAAPPRARSRKSPRVGRRVCASDRHPCAPADRCDSICRALLHRLAIPDAGNRPRAQPQLSRHSPTCAPQDRHPLRHDPGAKRRADRRRARTMACGACRRRRARFGKPTEPGARRPRCSPALLREPPCRRRYIALNTVPPCSREATCDWR